MDKFIDKFEITSSKQIIDYAKLSFIILLVILPFLTNVKLILLTEIIFCVKLIIHYKLYETNIIDVFTKKDTDKKKLFMYLGLLFLIFYSGEKLLH